jgi:peptide deformylase
MRKPNIQISYLDEQFKEHTENYDGLIARVIQHEYDHIEGKLFVDYLSPLKKRMLEGKLKDISNGKIDTEYRMKFPRKK